MNNINIALAYINGTENPLKVFCNLFIYVLNKADNQKLRIDEVKEALTKEFGLKVPNHIIKACARVLKKVKCRARVPFVTQESLFVNENLIL